MGIFSRLRRRRGPYAAVTDEERIARYVYLLNTLPAGVIERAHADAFSDVPAEKRREMFEQLRPFMSDSERDAASDDPHVLATLVRRAHERRAARESGQSGGADGTVATLTDRRHASGADAADPAELLRSSGILNLVALHFVASAAVNSYFLYGAGSLLLADQPAWIGDMVDPGAAGASFDAGGAGYDGGGFGGGFDGGGFGGGFDGGGGGFG